MKSKEMVEISRKGQLLIPKSYRDKTGINRGELALSVDRNKLIVNPLPDDPIEASRGFLKGGSSLGEVLLKDRLRKEKKEKTLRR